MILAISIFVVVLVLLDKKNDGKIWVKEGKSLTIRIHNIFFVPSAIYIIWFILNYFNIV